MLRINRKRPLELDDADTASKMARIGFGVGTVTKNTSPSFSNPLESPTESTFDEGNEMATFYNAKMPSFGRVPTPKGWERMPALKLFDNNCSPRTKSFLYQPLEEYRKAEALRLLFSRHGLQYKQPESDIHLLSEESLAPYITRWEECFDHWYPVLGSGTHSETQPKEHRSLGNPKVPLESSTSTPYTMETESSMLSAATPSGTPKADGMCQFDPHLAHLCEDVCNLLPSNQIIPAAHDLAIDAQLRKIVQAEIRRQFETLKTRTTGSDTISPDERFQNIDSTSNTDIHTTRKNSLLSRRKRSRTELPPASSSEELDDLVELPEMLPGSGPTTV